MTDVSGLEEIMSDDEPVSVRTADDIRNLPPTVSAVIVRELDDGKADALRSCPTLKAVFQDGKPRITAVGVGYLAELPNLEHLDLEWAFLTDDAVRALCECKTLRFLDIGFTKGYTTAALEKLIADRPELEIDADGSST